ncbi:hypothetical protein H072_4158 [Dactylellina haptotyla CBS 200.50]|uniref:NAD(P)-binding protein n=1 Tax=Dactylellina haptotyla (strain CBS 200.50) TaxID=1284197 RepID=S8AFS4_DACHA|nr:hypothetical protein H072_4158 [Dactylellina haptotyla CBS 200.50]
MNIRILYRLSTLTRNIIRYATVTSAKPPRMEISGITKYASLHAAPNGPGDARPTALQIIQDEGLLGKLPDKVFLVTGCTSGIGVETAKALYATGARLFLPVRDLKKGVEVVEEIRSSYTGNQHAVELLHVELDSLDSLLKSTLLASATPEFPSRVVTVTSGAHGITAPLRDDYNFEKIAYDPWKSYGQSKSANIWMANEIERRYGSKGLHATSVTPGLIWSGLQKHVGEDVKKGWEELEDWKPLWKTAAQGAATTVWAAVGEAWKGKGGLLSHCQAWKPAEEEKDGYAAHAFDEEGEGVLWRDSCGMVGVEADGD